MHIHDTHRVSRKLVAASIATFLFVIVELSVVVLENSLAVGGQALNIRSAVIHMLGDAVSSAGIIIAAILIRITGAQFWDPAVSMLIGVLILWSSWGILSETINLLLEGTPRAIDPDAVTSSI